MIRGPVEKGEYGDRVSIKWIRGHDPDLVLRDENDKEVRRHQLAGLGYQDIDRLLVTYGFHKSNPSAISAQSDVPKLIWNNDDKAEDAKFQQEEFFDDVGIQTKDSKHGMEIHIPNIFSNTGESKPTRISSLNRKFFSGSPRSNNIRGDILKWS
mmetsp:Transcript_11674/g.15864  ORF Transcript_11674/g.15864 Transcript_11674/m.15864 type:complete len:154 (+) Transcript_11674:171-632(+)|eukprot:CAMPEP_0196586734 /NCGR_PEP_ID=MMETSP1081-20130531/55373_1 /TAXON_ID=36882 /ORGANISM="Pyramimonas amylifera, Strain CCMP720" /LENGTH=153 /DNA_ID=CAMNT_0041908711 /DNA_START=170 /DNA_END=631 /DNA_ORIENTATION=+